MALSNTLSLTRADFLDSVLRLKPRVAAFDCDGTLWSSDAGETFLRWEIEARVVSPEIGQHMRDRYAEYKAGKVGEDEMCAEMVTMHAGLTDAAVMVAATEFMDHVFPGRPFAEMLELVGQLRKLGCDIWAVSSSNEWVIRAGVKQFGIAEDHILATKAAQQNGVITDRIIRIPSGPGKPQALREFVHEPIDAAFGNSNWDIELLASARHAFAVNPNSRLEPTARKQGWAIYFPEAISRP